MAVRTTDHDRHQTDTDDEIVRYYDVCWSERIRKGHNATSLAIHFGYYRTGRESTEQAKLELNRLLGEQLEIGDAPFVLLDAGCGVGGTSIDLAQRFPRLKMAGVNLS